MAVGGSVIAHERIRQAIVEGRYRPGQRLVEQRLADELNLSRTPVRQALHLLEAEGLVVSERNRGAMVRPLTEKDLFDMYELRARLEALAAERAAARCTEEDVQLLDAAIAEFACSIPAAAQQDLDGTRRLQAANRRFHEAILRMADSPPLASALPRSVDVPLVFQAFRTFTRAETERSNLFHRLIRDALARREPDRAGPLMSEHIFLGRDTLLAASRRDGPRKLG